MPLVGMGEHSPGFQCHDVAIALISGGATEAELGQPGPDVPAHHGLVALKATASQNDSPSGELQGALGAFSPEADQPAPAIFLELDGPSPIIYRYLPGLELSLQGGHNPLTLAGYPGAVRVKLRHHATHGALHIALQASLLDQPVYAVVEAFGEGSPQLLIHLVPAGAPGGLHNSLRLHLKLVQQGATPRPVGVVLEEAQPVQNHHRRAQAMRLEGSRHPGNARPYNDNGLRHDNLLALGMTPFTYDPLFIQPTLSPTSRRPGLGCHNR